MPIKSQARWPARLQAKSHKAQSKALTALCEVIWNNKRFAGGFLWKWYPDHEKAGGKTNTMFTVQNKAAEKVVRNYYKPPSEQ